MIADLKRPVLQPLRDSLFVEKQLDVSVLRLDTIHPFVSGNKLYKLKYNMEAFQRSGKEYLVTFGGAYSNHIVATAAAGKAAGINTIGIIRGDELNESSNARLRFASDCGMQLKFIPRDEYRQWRNDLKKEKGPFIAMDDAGYFLPEGGSNELAVKGCMEIVNEIENDFGVICCACGTGATLAGISASLGDRQKAIGIAVLRGSKFLEDDIRKMNGGRNNLEVIHDYHFGGYAGKNNELEEFCRWFIETHSIAIEPLYTGRLFFALYKLAKKDFFTPQSKIVVVHTGGIFDVGS